MYLVTKDEQMPFMEKLPGSYKFLILGCIFIASFGYVWDGYKQKSTNACLQRLESDRNTAALNYSKAMKGGSINEKRLAAQYAKYLSQNSDKVCDGL